jgi:glycosyltransferase involved in cell wall biosynthesis
MSYSVNILYLTVNENITSEKEGVAKKLLAKVAAIQSISSSCRLLNAIINYGHNDTVTLTSTGTFINIEIGVKQANEGLLKKIKSDVLFYEKLAAYIEQNQISFDRIIFRYPFVTKGLKHFCERFDKKVVFEHNSKEIEEQRLVVNNKQYGKFGIFPSQFFYWYQEKVYPLYAEKYLFKATTDHAFAGSCVTREIAGYEKKRNPAYRTFVSSNFYDVSAASISSSHYEEDIPLALGMIITTTAPWYGLERLLRSFSKVQEDYRLIVAGIAADNDYVQKLLQKYRIIRHVRFLGKLSKEELPAFYNSVHVCFGSLGLHTIHLNYASTLKVKESVSFGIPVILGYYEEDFVGNPEFEPYFLQLTNDDSVIDFSVITQFAKRFYSDPQNKQRLRQLAFKYLDVRVKMDLLVQHIAPEKDAV